ncbi:MAG: FliM/FliN family flagellar motor switch protein [Pirellulales bacterium]|nr:FliM/FliN family flagellar motor switch protein [Pirellulales bacterium]
MLEHAAGTCVDGWQFTVVLGRCSIPLGEAQRLSAGQVMTLDEPTDSPVEIYAAGRLVARGELLTLDGRFCVRVTEVFAEQALPRAA